MGSLGLSLLALALATGSPLRYFAQAKQFYSIRRRILFCWCQIYCIRRMGLNGSKCYLRCASCAPERFLLSTLCMVEWLKTLNGLRSAIRRNCMPLIFTSWRCIIYRNAGEYWDRTGTGRMCKARSCLGRKYRCWSERGLNNRNDVTLFFIVTFSREIKYSTIVSPILSNSRPN